MKSPDQNTESLVSAAIPRTHYATAIGLGLAALSTPTQAAGFYSDFANVLIGPDPDVIAQNPLIGSVTFNFAVPSITAGLGTPLGRTVDFNAFDSFQKTGKGKTVAAGSFRAFGSAQVSISSLLLASGTQIDGSTVWTPFELLPPNLTDAYTGVRVETSPGSFNYGWIRFSTGPGVPGASPPGNASSVLLLDAGFETTPGAFILAGQVPEASTNAALVFLGLAGGAAAFRRCRSRKAAATGAALD